MLRAMPRFAAPLPAAGPAGLRACGGGAAVHEALAGGSERAAGSERTPHGSERRSTSKPAMKPTATYTSGSPAARNPASAGGGTCWPVKCERRGNRAAGAGPRTKFRRPWAGRPTLWRGVRGQVRRVRCWRSPRTSFRPSGSTRLARLRRRGSAKGTAKGTDGVRNAPGGDMGVCTEPMATAGQRPGGREPRVLAEPRHDSRVAPAPRVVWRCEEDRRWALVAWWTPALVTGGHNSSRQPCFSSGIGLDWLGPWCMGHVVDTRQGVGVQRGAGACGGSCGIVAVSTQRYQRTRPPKGHPGARALVDRACVTGGGVGARGRMQAQPRARPALVPQRHLRARTADTRPGVAAGAGR